MNMKNVSLDFWVLNRMLPCTRGFTATFSREINFVVLVRE